MKRILTILATTVLLVAALCVSASASDFDGAAQDLAGIGVFRGTASGFELDRAPTRSEAAIMLVRLYGAEDEAKASYEAGEITHPFSDVSAFTSPYVAWLYNKGLTNGISATAFGSANACSAKMYSVFLLRALGYQDGTDFAYDDALTFAAEKGLMDTSFFTGTFLRDDLAAVTCQALATDLKDGSTYLLDSLIQSGAVDAEAARPMTEKMETYRQLLSVTAETVGNSLDTDITLKMDMDMAMTGTSEGQPVSEQETVSLTGGGRIQMILDEANPQMGMELTMTAMGETTDIGMWLKDGWVYIRQGETAYKQDISGDLSEALGAYQELLNTSMSQMNVSMLPYIDSITAEKSGSDTVYTLALNDAMSGMVDDIMGMLSSQPGAADPGLAMELSMDKCVYTYTVGSSGQLKTCTASMAMGMKMDMSADAQNTVSVAMDMDMDMTMKVNAAGKSVKVTYPDLSKFQEIEAIMQAEPELSPEPPSVASVIAA